jgi:hypothetical protein
MRNKHKTSNPAPVSWLPVAAQRGATTSEVGWPKFSRKVEDFPEFKKQWHKISKTGISDKLLLRVLWEHCLPLNLSRKPDMFSEVAEVWEWLCRLFEPNVLSYAVQYDYEKCPDRYELEEWYFSFLQIKAEFFASDGIQLWNMAVVEEILRKVPSHERLLWHVQSGNFDKSANFD